MNPIEAVQHVLNLCGGKVVGRTRLQKTAYLLESFGCDLGFDFDYHYYGPYSENLSCAADDAKALGLIREENEVSSTGLQYSIFKVESDGGREINGRGKAICERLRRFDATTLELAATADFLRKNGFAEDPWAETKRRKSVKATDERLTKAKRLLDELAAI